MTLMPNDVVENLRIGLKERGFKKNGFAWTWQSAEVVWKIRVDRPPYGNRVYIEVFAAPLLEEFRTGESLKANDFPIFPVAQELPLDIDFDVGVLDFLDYCPLADDECARKIRELGYALGQFAHEHSTVESLVRAYAAGVIPPHYVTGDLKRKFNAAAREMGLPAPPMSALEGQ